MASLANILVCAVSATLIYTCLGLPIAQRVTQRPLAYFMAPVIGWAGHNVLAVPLLVAIGFTRPAVTAIFVLPLVIAVVTLWRNRALADGEAGLPGLSALALAG